MRNALAEEVKAEALNCVIYPGLRPSGRWRRAPVDYGLKVSIDSNLKPVGTNRSS
jgi:hypothetical protein